MKTRFSLDDYGHLLALLAIGLLVVVATVESVSHVI